MAKRIINYIVALMLVAGAVGAALLVPDDAASRAADVQPVRETVVPGSISLACPGPLVTGTTDLASGQDLTFDPQFDPNKVKSVPAMRAVVVAPQKTAAAATWQQIGAKSPQQFTAAGPVGVASSASPAAASILSTQPSAQGSPALAGVVVSRATAGDLRGLAGASCQPAMSEAYLVGGDTRTETTANLFFVNLGATAAEVNVSLWGVSGPVRTLATDAIVVPARSTRALQLPGIARDEQRMVVRVQATGGEVASYMQDSRLDGITPQGVDYVVPSQPPATAATITGLRLTKTGDEPAHPAVIRLLAPGAKAAKVTIRLDGPGGPYDQPGLDGIELDAGIVTDIPLAGMPAGTYTATITSDQPVVAGAQLTNPSDAPGAVMDRAWVPSSAAASSGLLALPAGVTSTVTLHAVANATVTLTPIDAAGKRGKPRTVTVAKNKTVSLAAADLAGGDLQAVEFSAKAPVSLAAVVTSPAEGGDLVTVLTPPASAAPQSAIDVATATRLGL